MLHILLNTAYLPPISYFASMAAGVLPLSGHSFAPSTVYIEASESYQKQSYRNRCHFYAECGLSSLSFPVVHAQGPQLVSSIPVDYSVPWVRQHERAIVSAYRTSAYFDYYRDEFFDILESRHETLFSLNMALIRFFIEKVGLPVNIRLTEDYVKAESVVDDGVWKGLPYVRSIEACDLRDVIHPKRENDILHRMDMEKPYFQVFSGKYGFIPDLSIMDLLFNEGPDSISYFFPAIGKSL